MKHDEVLTYDEITNGIPFENWWTRQEKYKGKSIEFKEECQKGWDDACKSDSISFLRGIGPYCEGWNGLMGIRKDRCTLCSI